MRAGGKDKSRAGARNRPPSNGSSGSRSRSASGPRRKSPVSAGKSEKITRAPRRSAAATTPPANPREGVFGTTGRRPEIRRYSHHRFTRLTTTLFVDHGAYAAWFENAIEMLTTWGDDATTMKRCLVALDEIVMMVGELVHAGQVADETDARGVDQTLPFTIDDAIEVARSIATGAAEVRAPYTGEQARGITFDTLYRHVFPLAMARAEEAMRDRGHRYNAHVWLTYGQTIRAMTRCGFVRRAEQPQPTAPSWTAGAAPVTPEAVAAARPRTLTVPGVAH